MATEWWHAHSPEGKPCFLDGEHLHHRALSGESRHMWRSLKWFRSFSFPSSGRAVVSCSEIIEVPPHSIQTTTLCWIYWREGSARSWRGHRKWTTLHCIAAEGHACWPMPLNTKRTSSSTVVVVVGSIPLLEDEPCWLIEADRSPILPTMCLRISLAELPSLEAIFICTTWQYFGTKMPADGWKIPDQWKILDLWKFLDR